MFKKIAILVILMTLLIAGNLLASQTINLRVWVWAQDEVYWVLYVDGETAKEGYGDKYCGEQPDWEFLPYEVTFEGTVVTSGTFPGNEIYDIVVPITVPSNEDPEE